jgi:hypothetical protein
MGPLIRDLPPHAWEKLRSAYARATGDDGRLSLPEVLVHLAPVLDEFQIASRDAELVVQRLSKGVDARIDDDVRRELAHASSRFAFGDAVPLGPPSALDRIAPPAQLKLGVFGDERRFTLEHEGPHFRQHTGRGRPFAERVRQRFLVCDGSDRSVGQKGAVFTETHALVFAPPDKVLEGIRDERLANKATVEDRTLQSDGSYTFSLWPGGRLLGIKMNYEMHEPQRLDDGSYLVLVDITPMPRDGLQLIPPSAVGTAYFLVRPQPDGRSCDFIARFADVIESAPLSAATFARGHLRGERGALPLPADTGYGAMVARVEAAAAAI